MTDRIGTLCPYCGGSLEHGHLLRRPSGIDIGDFRIRWVAEGKEAVDAPLGDFKFMKGSFVNGYRCSKCRKIILDY